MTKSKISGTYEWAVATVNCTQGCKNACAYCYSRKIAAMRGDIKSFAEWSELRPKRDIKKEMKKYEGTVMFPSTHDIHPENLFECKRTILNLLGAGNNLLIVSKPNIKCMLTLFKDLEEYQEKIMFRYTIGTTDSKLLKIWEPGAPSFEERFACLVTAKALGFSTSISMEPFLSTDMAEVKREALYLLPYCTGPLWIGKMNKISERVGGVPREEIKKIEEAQRDSNIKILYESLKDNSQIHWKESIKEVVGLPPQQEPGMDM